MKFLRATYLWLLLAPWIISTLGAAANQAAIIANGDMMPVRINVVKAIEWSGTPVEFGTPEDGKHHIIVYPDGTAQLDSRHCMMNSRSRLKWLSDVFDFNSSTESVGDLFIHAGRDIASFCTAVWLALVVVKIRKCGPTPNATAS